MKICQPVLPEKKKQESFFSNAGKGYKVSDHFHLDGMLHVFMKVAFTLTGISGEDMRRIVLCIEGRAGVKCQSRKPQCGNGERSNSDSLRHCCPTRGPQNY